MTELDLAHIDRSGSLGDQLEAIIAALPEDHLTLGQLLQVFGAAILLVGISRVFRRPLWLPAKLRARALPAARLRPALDGGLHWVRRLEKISKPYRLRGMVEGMLAGLFNNLAFILAALLLMAPFGFVPFSNTLPGLALLLYAIGMIQRDGTAILLGHLANIGTIVYFGILIGGGGMAAHGLLRHFTG